MPLLDVNTPALQILTFPEIPFKNNKKNIDWLHGLCDSDATHGYP